MHQAFYIFSRTNRQPTFLYNSLIRGYNSIKLYSQSLYVFSQMVSQRKVFDPNTLPTVLKACAGLSSLRMGMIVHVGVVINGFASESGNLNGLVTMYGKCGDLASARKVFDEMPDRFLVSWSAMMGGCGIHDVFDQVFVVYERMVECGLVPDGVTFTSVLSVCSHGGFTDKGMEYFEMMKERFGLRPGLERYTCVVDMLGRAGKFDEAERVIDDIEVVETDDALLNALCASCKIHGRTDVAERICEKIYGRRLIASSL